MENKLILENMRLAYKIAWKFKGTKVDMEELQAAALLGLCKAANTFQSESGNKFSAYAGKCIENEVLMFLRSERKHYGVCSLDEPITEDGAARWELVRDKENPIEKEENRIFLSEITEKLKPREKRVLCLYYGEDRTQKEIGVLYGLEQSTVSKILINAAKKIRKEL